LKELRARKAIVRKKLEHSNQLIVGGNCQEGDCGTSVHVKLNDPLEMLSVVKKLLSNDIIAMPITGRPAHVCWQWMDQFNKERFHHPEMNPYKDNSLKYKKVDFLKTVENLSSTLKIFLDLDGSDREFEKKADKIAGLF
jgi:hypothetical protein